MSDQDRGPYAPQSDAPLAFDPRQSRGGGGGPAPMTLLVSAIILMALIVGILLFYRHGVRHPDQPATLVGAPVAQTKAAPPSTDAAASDAAANLQVYKSEATPSGEGQAPPAFQGDDEQPAPLPAARPVQPPPPIVNAPLRHADETPASPRHHAAPKPITVAKLPPAPVALLPLHMTAPPAHVAVSPAEPVTHSITPSPKPAMVASTSSATLKSESAAKPKSKPAPTDVKTTEAKSTEAKVAAAKPEAEPKPTTTAASGAVTVQIGAFSSATLAQQGWSDTAHVLPSAMAGKSRRVESTVKDGKTFYRSFVGGFASKADAEAFCTSLRARSRPCMVK